ncbi:hypothetical protein ABEG18_13190 [Alsobacter sp. KACC 23698]|uniref:Cbb3-type cytochrome oxidase assembly protein CcoS n=1 Tax=Alsobacter sp. KACC 23698 TaxID=3149229 RepID=A0AAU7J8M5_9HYPH
MTEETLILVLALATCLGFPLITIGGAWLLYRPRPGDEQHEQLTNVEP